PSTMARSARTTTESIRGKANRSRGKRPLVEDLESAIVHGDLAPVYLLCGTDPLLYQRAVGALVARLVTPETRAFNHDAFEGKSASAAQILAAARTLPMMAKRRLVVVRDVEGLGADGMGALAGYLDAPAPETTLVLQAQKADGRIKLFQVPKKKGFLHELEVPKNLIGWIGAEAARRRARFSDDAARRLADVVGPDLGRLASTIEQLALYVGGPVGLRPTGGEAERSPLNDGRAVTAEDVDELVAETREQRVFELAKAVRHGPLENALGC